MCYDATGLYMWSLFLIEHLYFERAYSEGQDTEQTCVSKHEFELCTNTYKQHSRFNSSHNWEALRDNIHYDCKLDMPIFKIHRNR